ncbi:MAG: hypothetical protein H7338_20925, partial [Candidatus Sericytochromatia bacterium]|nr:hypothetical protein [Candidatus Sericytochromatia bacterium]
MTPDQDTFPNDAPAPKQGWFDRLKVRIGIAKDAPADTTPAIDPSAAEAHTPAAASTVSPVVALPNQRDESAAIAAPAATSVEALASDVAAVDARVTELATVEAVARDVAAVDTLATDVAGVGTHADGVPAADTLTGDSQAATDLMAADVAAVDALVADLATVGTPAEVADPVVVAVIETPAAVESLAADVAAVDALAHEIASVVTPEPVAVETPPVMAVEAVVADVATGDAISAEDAVVVLAEAPQATDTPVAPSAPAADEAVDGTGPGSWLDRFRGRLGLGLGTPAAPETEWYGQATDEAPQADAILAVDAELLAAEAAAVIAAAQAAEQAERDSWFDR